MSSSGTVASAMETVLEQIESGRRYLRDAVDELREIDTVQPAERRKLVAALDDVLAEAQRFGGALNRLGERSQQNQAITAVPADADTAALVAAGDGDH